MHLWKITSGCRVRVISSQGKITHTMTFSMLRERKSWSNDFRHGGRYRVSERKGQRLWKKDREKEGNRAEMRRPNVPVAGSWTGDRGDNVEGAFSESLPEGAPGMVEELLVLLGQRRPGGTTTRILLLLCWGRREGWRNNLDGLGLIKEKERNRQRDKNSTHCKIKGSGVGLPTKTPTHR